MGGIFAIVVMLYVGLAYSLAGQIPGGTTISGVDVSGQTAKQARHTLETELHEALIQPREVTIAGIDHDQAFLDPQAMHLAVDYDKTLTGLTGFSLNPARIWRHLFGGENYFAYVRSDSQAVMDQLQALATAVNQEALDAHITIEQGQASLSQARDGVVLDEQGAQKVIAQSWLAGGDPLLLPSTSQEAHITSSVAQEFIDSVLTPLLSDDISVNVKDHLVQLTPVNIGDLIDITYSDSVEFTVDGDKLRALIDNLQPGLLALPSDARVEIENSAVKITPASDGETLNAQSFTADLRQVVSTKNRTITASIDVVNPQVSTADIEKLGITEIVSEISTPITSDQVRTTNLIVGSQYVANTLVRPGETFDLQTALGPLEESRGFVSSGVFVNGFASTALGGGLSQLATNVFNVGYRAGLEDVAHTPHTVYYDRYPKGLESTLWYDHIYVKWKNTTPYGVVLESFVDGQKLTTRLWSTKYFDVSIHQGQPYGVVPAETRTNPAADCEPSTYKKDGFSIEVGRTVSLHGEVVEDSRKVVHYSPTHAVTCQ